MNMQGRYCIWLYYDINIVIDNSNITMLILIMPFTSRFADPLSKSVREQGAPKVFR